MTSRRRRLHQRQSVIFGSLALLLVITLIVAITHFFGILPSPFARDFSTDPADRPTPAPTAVCPPEGAAPVDPAGVTLNVFNGTSRTGLAAATAKLLDERGFTVAKTGNFDLGYDGSALIRVNEDQIAAGYTVSRLIEGSLVVLHPRESETVDVIIGDGYSNMGSVEDIGTDPFERPDNCRPAEEAAPAEQTSDE
ncbi:MAG: LytR C-terminal domain-containing protein [Bowdeniella nasicola]|nr:LytR C-terminal domain-containing protein [Bowdeniella nasicola]